MTAFLRLPEVTRRVGLARATVYRDIAAGKFPKPIRIGPGAVAWIESEIEEWAQAQIRAARSSNREPRVATLR